MEALAEKLRSFWHKNRNAIISYGVWLAGSYLAFICLSALIAFLPRFVSYFWMEAELPRFLGFLHRMLIVPAGIGFLGVLRLGYEVVSKNAIERPDRVWKFYTVLFAVEFTVLFLAAKI